MYRELKEHLSQLPSLFYILVLKSEFSFLNYKVQADSFEDLWRRISVLVSAKLYPAGYYLEHVSNLFGSCFDNYKMCVLFGWVVFDNNVTLDCVEFI